MGFSALYCHAVFTVKRFLLLIQRLLFIYRTTLKLSKHMPHSACAIRSCLSRNRNLHS